ncbi:MAG: metallophosphoesterase [Actinomycetota bacterium]
MRILAVADEPVLEDPRAIRRIDPDLVVACGDLPFDYLEFLEDCTDVPLLYVPGNHDPDLKPGDQSVPVGVVAGLVQRAAPPGPPGCTNVDGKTVGAAGLWVGGLGGSVRYREGPNQYSQRRMRRRAVGLAARTLLRRPRRRLDLLLTHAPPFGLGDDDDPPHVGFTAFHRLTILLGPTYLIHGHVHPYGPPRPDRAIGETTVVNAAGFRVLEMDARPEQRRRGAPVGEP